MKGRRQVGARFVARARGAFGFAVAKGTGNGASLGPAVRRGPDVAQHGLSLTDNGRVPVRLKPALRVATAPAPMASLPKRPCNSPGCRTLCDWEAYCPEHKRQTQRQHDERRGTSAERG